MVNEFYLMEIILNVILNIGYIVKGFVVYSIILIVGKV